MEISDKVICLIDFKRELTLAQKAFHPILPEKNKVYVIRNIIKPIANCPIAGIYLTGITSLNSFLGTEMAFSSIHFATLKDYRKHSIDLKSPKEWNEDDYC